MVVALPDVAVVVAAASDTCWGKNCRRTWSSSLRSFHGVKMYCTITGDCSFFPFLFYDLQIKGPKVCIAVPKVELDGFDELMTTFFVFCFGCSQLSHPIKDFFLPFFGLSSIRFKNTLPHSLTYWRHDNITTDPAQPETDGGKSRSEAFTLCVIMPSSGQTPELAKHVLNP